MFRVAVLVFAVLVAAYAPRVCAQEFSSLEERMTDSEFRAAGLDRLSPEELSSLNEWLRSRLNAIPNTTVSRSQEGFKPEDGLLAGGGDRGEIVSSIDGAFDGWSKGTVLKLANGQWWEITDDRSFAIPETMNPGVTISPAMLGSWLLKVDGFNRSARATRVR
jgi:hypothetical protein